MRDDEGGIDLSILDSLDEQIDVIEDVALPHADRDTFLERGAERDHVEKTAIDAG